MYIRLPNITSWLFYLFFFFWGKEAVGLGGSCLGSWNINRRVPSLIYSFSNEEKRFKQSAARGRVVYDVLYDWTRVGDELTMRGSEKENVKWTLLTVTMPLKLPENKEVLWCRCWRASKRTSELSELDRELSLPFPLLYRYSYSYSLLLALHRPHHTTCVVLRIKLILSTL